MTRSHQAGIAAALLAAFVWSLNFVVPFVIGDYTVFDFALLRFGVSGLVGFAVLLARKESLRRVPLQDWLVTAWLAFIGYVGYFLTVAGAALHAGPVIAPAILGLVPIVLAIVGNIRQGSVPWLALMPSLLLVATGLLLVNLNALFAAHTVAAHSLWIGLPLAIASVALWTWFAVANQAALAARPKIDSGLWTALTLIGGGVEMLLFFPLGLKFGLFELPILGFGWSMAAPLYLWGASLALLASVGGVWAWTLAARNLPVALAAQLIVSETAFGVIFGLFAHHRWPTPAEAAGVVLLIIGVVMAIRAFQDTHAQIRRPVAQDP